MNIKAFIEFKQYDKQGNLIDTKKIRANSLVHNYMVLMSIMLGGISQSIKKTNGGTYSMSASYLDNITTTAPAGDIAYGIMAGTGENAVTINDYALQTPIAHGSGSGQLEYDATTVGEATISGSNSYTQVDRVLTNTSGGTINIKEIALGFYYSITGAFIIDRSLVDYSILTGNLIKVRYTLQITV